MSTSANIRSYHVVVDAPAQAVFDAMTDLRNMPRWSIHWCKGMRLVEGGAIVTTPTGEVFFTVSGDSETGVLDWWSGPTRETAVRWPTRVVDLAGGGALYQVTAIFRDQPPPNVDQWFADELNALRQLVEEQLVSA